MSAFKDRIAHQKQQLANLAAGPLAALAVEAPAVWQAPAQLDQVLLRGLRQLPHCHMLYAVDTHNILISANVEDGQLDTQWRGLDLSGRPYLNRTLPWQGFTLSGIYTSRHSRRPCITAMQAVRDGDNILGFIAADYNVEDLPGARNSTPSTGGWSQYKGDPAIRGTVFQQQRAISAMDKVLDEVMNSIAEMLCYHGIFHVKIHFSSSRASFWSLDDPYDYNIHMLDEIVDPERCLAYPRRPAHERTQVSIEDICRVLDQFKTLRHADETIYLRSASFNIINGMVGLTFSCDGSHYIHFRQFLEMDSRFWFGETTRAG
ncbi:MAG: PDC sensor domain-containing protein [Thiohalophilus sp.]